MQMTQTMHQIVMEDARDMTAVEDESVDLVVTSPPYPMIQMWDAYFCQAVPAVAEAISQSDGDKAFELMHLHLDAVWSEIHRKLKPGGILCINIGDATRSVGEIFQLWPNHVRVAAKCRELGLFQLPAVLWRKPTNAPTKFMGSGMLPPGAYITLEHEYILIFRKGGQRSFIHEDFKKIRRESAYFWEERNRWFSDVWYDLRGTGQKLSQAELRSRSGAFPIELPYRLIHMFSVKGDLVLDPFMGTGTTLQAAMAAARNSIGYDIDTGLAPLILQGITAVPELAHDLVSQRLEDHMAFVQTRTKTKADLKYQNHRYGFAVMTRQEEDLCLDWIRNVHYLSHDHFKVVYERHPFNTAGIDTEGGRRPRLPGRPVLKGRQLKLF